MMSTPGQQTLSFFARMAATLSRRQRRPGPATENPLGIADLDRIDRRILKILQDDGRASISQIAREVHLSVTPCLTRVRRLEAAGFIRGYFAQLDPERLELSLQAYVTVSLDRTTSDVFDRFRDAMHRFDEVIECQMVGGGFDYLVKVRVRDMKAFRKFLGQCLTKEFGIQQTHTYFVMEEIKSTHKLKVQG
jgi:Lrp/AsnC family transcriptional regulator, leucine-responsive regulatory protein